MARAVTRRDRQYRVDTPKSGLGRAVVIPPHIRDDIRAHLEDNVGPEPGALLFPSAGGAHLNDRVFSREYFAKAFKAIGREKVRVHDLRHFSGSQVARVGNHGGRRPTRSSPRPFGWSTRHGLLEKKKEPPAKASTLPPYEDLLKQRKTPRRR